MIVSLALIIGVNKNTHNDKEYKLKVFWYFFSKKQKTI